MSDTSTKRAEKVALLHETRSRFAGSEKEKTFDLATAALLRSLAAERDALLKKSNERDALHTQDLLEIQTWREANPNSTPWPPKKRLVSWLLDEMTSLRAALGEKE